MKNQTRLVIRKIHGERSSHSKKVKMKRWRIIAKRLRQDKASDALDANNNSQYVTLANIAKLIEREQAKISKMPRQFVRQPL